MQAAHVGYTWLSRRACRLVPRKWAGLLLPSGSDLDRCITLLELSPNPTSVTSLCFWGRLVVLFARSQRKRHCCATAAGANARAVESFAAWGFLWLVGLTQPSGCALTHGVVMQESPS